MLKNPRVVSLTMLSVLVISGCAGPRAAEGPGQGQAAPVVSNRPLVIQTRGEPITLPIRAFRTVGGGSYPHLVFNATFDDTDLLGNPFPVLAEGLPDLNTDSWKVFPDGTMQTTYHLKPGLVWHDGTSLDAADFAFAWQVYADPQSGTSSVAPLNEMQEVSAPDGRTVVIRWRHPYPSAALIATRNQNGFSALPRHILEQSYASGNFEGFANHAFWTDEFIGLGPYRLEHWERGQEIDAVGFDRFVFGPPKINRLRILIANDSNAAVATLLAGDADLSLDYVLQYPDGAVLQQQWGTGGTVLFNPTLYWQAQIQMRPDQMSTPLNADVRFRRALVHAMDKHGLNEALMGGTAVETDTAISPRVPYYASIEPVISKYPFDPRRAQQILEEIGLRKGSDGYYLGLDGKPFSLDLLALSNPTWEAETTILAEGYRKVGLNAGERVVPTSLFGDGQLRASMGTMHLTGGSGFEKALGVYTTSGISRPETRWQGSNRGAWANPDYDRLWDQYNTTLDVPSQIQILAQMEKIETAEVPQIGMYYEPLVTPYRAGLIGPQLRVNGNSDTLSTLWEWHWSS
ncbi:MAG TPA: ABC transporter substrate-binding protein [Chloroflexota bacterium]